MVPYVVVLHLGHWRCSTPDPDIWRLWLWYARPILFALMVGVLLVGALVSAECRFRVLLDRPVTVAWGGATSAANYHVYLPDQRWAYDLLVMRDTRSFRGDGSRLDDYYAYGFPVVARASGRVFESHVHLHLQDSGAPMPAGPSPPIPR